MDATGHDYNGLFSRSRPPARNGQMNEWILTFGPASLCCPCFAGFARVTQRVLLHRSAAPHGPHRLLPGQSDHGQLHARHLPLWWRLSSHALVYISTGRALISNASIRQTGINLTHSEMKPPEFLNKWSILNYTIALKSEIIWNPSPRCFIHVHVQLYIV